MFAFADDQLNTLVAAGALESVENAAASKEVQSSPAITALLEQSEFSCLQRIGRNFWNPVAAFTADILAGNPSEDAAYIRQIMDEFHERTQRIGTNKEVVEGLEKETAVFNNL